MSGEGRGDHDSQVDGKQIVVSMERPHRPEVCPEVPLEPPFGRFEPPFRTHIYYVRILTFSTAVFATPTASHEPGPVGSAVPGVPWDDSHGKLISHVYGFIVHLSISPKLYIPCGHVSPLCCLPFSLSGCHTIHADGACLASS